MWRGSQRELRKKMRWEDVIIEKTIERGRSFGTSFWTRTLFEKIRLRLQKKRMDVHCEDCVLLLILTIIWYSALRTVTPLDVEMSNMYAALDLPQGQKQLLQCSTETIKQLYKAKISILTCHVFFENISGKILGYINLLDFILAIWAQSPQSLALSIRNTIIPTKLILMMLGKCSFHIWNIYEKLNADQCSDTWYRSVILDFCELRWKKRDRLHFLINLGYKAWICLEKLSSTGKYILRKLLDAFLI